MKDFAKLFYFEETGQALITLSNGDDGPEIAVRIADICGVCPEIKMTGYGDNKEGWMKADNAFDAIDEARGRELALEVKKAVGDIIAHSPSPDNPK